MNRFISIGMVLWLCQAVMMASGEFKMLLFWYSFDITCMIQFLIWIFYLFCFVEDHLSLKIVSYYILHCSSTQVLLFIPRVNYFTLWDRAFVHAAPVLRNLLLFSIRTCSTLATLIKQLSFWESSL